ncbi:hypothetical protein Tco_1064251 [Tanacetum coccineum]
MVERLLSMGVTQLDMTSQSFIADEEVPTDMDLMAFSVFEFNKSEFNLATYKRGLASVEEQLVFYKKNEVLFCEQLVVLKKDISYKDSDISVLKSELEKFKQEKESNQLKIEKFNNASKSLDKLIWSQIPDKSRKGLGFVSYNAVPPPPTRLFSPPNLDLSNSGLAEFHSLSLKDMDLRLVSILVKILLMREKMVSGNNYTRVNYNYSAKKAHPSAHRNIVPRGVLMKTGLRPLNNARPGHPQKEDQGYVDSGCSRYMTRNMSYLSNFMEFDRGYVAFGGGAKGGRITGKGTLKTGKLDFEDAYFVKEL